MTPETVISGGTVVDGTGAPPRRADVVIGKGRILAIEPEWRGEAEVIDATGMTVASGFIDIHSHSD